jgi:hypothetical protein
MTYEAPKLVEVGSLHDLTLGRLLPGPMRDSSTWWGVLDIWGDPAPRGSR